MKHKFNRTLDIYKSINSNKINITAKQLLFDKAKYFKGQF